MKHVFQRRLSRPKYLTFFTFLYTAQHSGRDAGAELFIITTLGKFRKGSRLVSPPGPGALARGENPFGISHEWGDTTYSSNGPLASPNGSAKSPRPPLEHSVDSKYVKLGSSTLGFCALGSSPLRALAFYTGGRGTLGEV